MSRIFSLPWANILNKPSIGDLSGVLPLDKLPAHSHSWNDLAGLLPLDKLPAHTHDDRYYTKSQIDAGYAKLSGGNSFSGNQVVSGTIDASATLTGHRLGYLGFIDSVTLGWPGTSFGGFQSGASGVVSFASRSAGISSSATSVVSIGNGTYGDQSAQVRAGAFRAQGGNGVVGTLWVNNSNDTWSAFQFPASQNALTFSPSVAGLFRFEGTTNAHPALKRSGTTIQARLADDSADASFSFANLTASGSITVTGGITMNTRNIAAVDGNGDFSLGSGVNTIIVTKRMRFSSTAAIEDYSGSGVLYRSSTAHYFQKADGTPLVTISGSTGDLTLAQSSAKIICGGLTFQPNYGGSSRLHFGLAGTNGFFFNPNTEFSMSPSTVLGWCSTANGPGNNAAATGISRVIDGTLAIGNGVAGNASGNLRLTRLASYGSTDSAQMYWSDLNVAMMFRNAADNASVPVSASAFYTASGGVGPHQIYFGTQTAIEGQSYAGFGGLRLGSGQGVYFSSTTSYSGTPDVALTRGGAGILNSTGVVTSPFRLISADPSTLDISAGRSQLVKNTTSGEIRLWANDAGTMKKSAALT